MSNKKLILFAAPKVLPHSRVPAQEAPQHEQESAGAAAPGPRELRPVLRAHEPHPEAAPRLPRGSQGRRQVRIHVISISKFN